jgi:hypothetical protein
MARNMTGTGRVTIFPLLHLWETGSRCVLAYTTTDGGLTAVLGVLPVEGNVHEPGDLFGVAGRHGRSRAASTSRTPSGRWTWPRP